MGERVILFDDIDGTEGPEVERHRFEFEGVRCEIDLTGENWGRLYAAVKPFLDKARQEGAPVPSQPPARAPERPAERPARAKANQVPEQREPSPAEVTEPVPMSGGFGDYTWESDGTMSGKIAYCTRAEKNACMRWVYAHNGKAGQFSRAALAAFRAQDERLIPGWGDPPTEEDLAPKVGTVGLVLRDAVEGKRAKQINGSAR